MSLPDPASPTQGQPNGPGFVAPAQGQPPYPAPGSAPLPAGPPNPYPPGPPPAVVTVVERVGRGLVFALVAIPVAAGVAALIWRLGFIASISSFVLAAAAALLYAKGSGGVVRKGLPIVIAIIVVGTVVSWFAVIATDLAMYYPELDAAQLEAYPTRGSFIADNLFYGPVVSTYLKDLGLFALFAALGTFGVLRRLWQAARTPA